VVTVALALGAHRMAQRHALVRRLPAVETLGSVSVLATDKTGTLTENRMVVRKLTAGSARFDLTGSGYAPAGDVLAIDVDDPGALERLARDVALCNDAELVPPDEGSPEWRALGDPMEAALIALAGKAGADTRRLRAEWERVAEIPFDSHRRRMTTTHRRGAGLLTVCKGAPEVVLGLPAMSVREGLDVVRAEAAALAADGYRVLAVADRWDDASTGGRDGDPAAAADESGLDLVGLVAVVDPPRSAAADVVAQVRSAGLRLVLITGDHPDTAAAIARDVGLPAAPVVTGDELAAGMAPGSLADVAVFARTRPEQKLEIVRGLRADGHVVAMTGDGVNDAPALREADIGVAMGRGGTEVARQAADLVLTDDELGTVVAAVEEGRRIYSNVRRFLRYAISGGFAEVLVMLVGPLLGLGVPLLPAQILWVNLLTHGLPGVAMGTEPADPRAMRRPPRRPDEFVLGDGLLGRIAWTGTLIAVVSLAGGLWAQHTGGSVRTEVFLVLALAQIGVAVALRQAGHGIRPRALDLAVLGAVALQLAAIWWAPLRELLGTVEPSGRAVLVAAVLAVLPGVVTAVQVRRRS
jgi:Ca2+-transporting ATPase